MPSFIHRPKDFWSGLIFISIGLLALVIARDYEMGTAAQMGPGYFPSILSALLTVFGVAALLRSLVGRGEPVSSFAFKALFLILGGVALFGFLVRSAGLVPAILVLVLVSAAASTRYRFSTAALLAVGMALFSVLVFIKGLGLPLQLFGHWFSY